MLPLTTAEATRLRDALRTELRRRDGLVTECEESLAAFARTFWHIVEPGRPMVEGWPLDAIAEHLEAVSRGEVTRLLMNVPPGFMKSLMTNVFYPAWEWGPRNMPTMRYASASYSQALTSRDNIRFRRVISSPDYRKFWGQRFGPAADQFNIVRVANDRTGWKLATSIGGIGTGERADRWIIDDANNVLESESEAVMESTNMWLREVMPDRLNDQVRSAIINIQQRTAENDASGTLLDMWGGDCVHLMIPMEFDSSRRCVTQIGWEDPRDEDGELAWPERFPEKAVENLKREKGPYAWAGQYQQSPAPRGGGIIKYDWWKLWPGPDYEEYEQVGVRGSPGYRPARFPDFEFLVTSVDTAYTEKEENDWCAATTWGVWRDRARLPRLMLVEAWEEHLELHALVQRVLDTCRRRKVDACLVEAKASGLSCIQEMRRLMRKGEFSVYGIDPKGDKVARMHAVVPLFADGLVYAPDKQWAQMVIDRVTTFPKGKRRDVPDTVSQALTWLRKSGIITLREEAQDEQYEALVLRGRSGESGLPYDV